MRILLTVLCVLLITGVVVADDVLVDRGDYRDRMMVELGWGTQGWNDVQLDAFIQEAIAFVVPTIGASKQTQIITLTYRENAYVLDSTTTDIVSVWWEKADTVMPLEHLPMSQWGKAIHDNTNDQPDGKLQRPSVYDYTDSLLYVYPPPSKASLVGDTIKVNGLHRIGNLAAVDTLTAIPAEYRNAVVARAVYKAALSRFDNRTSAFRENWIEVMRSVGLKRGVPVEAGK